MKSLLLLLTLFITTNSFAQKQKQKPIKRKVVQTENLVFEKVPNEPSFPGGLVAWQQFLQKNLKGDVPSNNGAPAGKYTVQLKFTVNKNGSLSNFVLQNNPGYGTGEEVIRLMKTSPKWKPGTQSGINVTSFFVQPVSFMVL
jgi:periplasmic protein TonB